MKKRQIKKLSLNRETLGSLEEATMKQAVGGTYVDSLCAPCTTATKCSDCCTIGETRTNCSNCCP
ncbi:MAG: class I lanthipeptide [Thermoanaerobaculia bacterium]